MQGAASCSFGASEPKQLRRAALRGCGSRGVVGASPHIAIHSRKHTSDRYPRACDDCLQMIGAAAGSDAFLGLRGFTVSPLYKLSNSGGIRNGPPAFSSSRTWVVCRVAKAFMHHTDLILNGLVSDPNPFHSRGQERGIRLWLCDQTCA